MKILYITTIGATMGFFTDLIHNLTEEGHTVDIACNYSDSKVPHCYKDWGCRVYKLDCSRSPKDPGNIRAIRQIRKLVEKNHYDIVHCHTPIAAACTRIACKDLRTVNYKQQALKRTSNNNNDTGLNDKEKNDNRSDIHDKANSDSKWQGTRVIYTAHGFHFYDGAPLKNWLVFYPIEKALSRYTDTLITINTEDYKRAKKEFHAKETYYVPGVGIDLEKFNFTLEKHAEIRKRKRKELGISDDDIVILSVGELNENKNHQVIIKALQRLQSQFHIKDTISEDRTSYIYRTTHEGDITDTDSATNGNVNSDSLGTTYNTKKCRIYYFIAGEGDKKSELQQLANECNVNLRLLGYRSDIPELLQSADIFALPSIREGLNVSLMEAMASGLPCICSDIRGNRDLIDDGKGGYRVNQRSEVKWSESIIKILHQIKYKNNTASENRTDPNIKSSYSENIRHISFGVYNRKKIESFSIQNVCRKMIKIYSS